MAVPAVYIYIIVVIDGGQAGVGFAPGQEIDGGRIPIYPNGIVRDF